MRARSGAKEARRVAVGRVVASVSELACGLAARAWLAGEKLYEGLLERNQSWRSGAGALASVVIAGR